MFTTTPYNIILPPTIDLIIVGQNVAKPKSEIQNKRSYDTSLHNMGGGAARLFFFFFFPLFRPRESGIGHRVK